MAITCLLNPSLFKAFYKSETTSDDSGGIEKKVIRRLDAAMGNSKQGTTNFEDIIQVVVGASALCVPVAFSEEAWNLGRTLPVTNIILLIVLSLLFVNLYSLHNIFQGRITHRVLTFFSRTIIVYGITLLVVVVVLAVLDHLPIIGEPWIAVRRVVVLSFPASMGAVVVDSFDKE